MDSPWNTCKAELGCSAAFPTAQTVLQPREPAWQRWSLMWATWVMTTSRHNMDLEKMRQTTPWWRLTRPSKTSWAYWSMIASRRWQSWWTNWVERCRRSNRKALTRAAWRNPITENTEIHSVRTVGSFRPRFLGRCQLWSGLQREWAGAIHKRQWTDGILRKSERRKKAPPEEYHLLGRKPNMWLQCHYFEAKLVLPWKGSNRIDTKVKATDLRNLSLAIIRNILISKRGESHFRICSCVHLHVSHVAVHLT